MGVGSVTFAAPRLRVPSRDELVCFWFMNGQQTKSVLRFTVLRQSMRWSWPRLCWLPRICALPRGSMRGPLGSGHLRIELGGDVGTKPMHLRSDRCVAPSFTGCPTGRHVLEGEAPEGTAA